MEYTIDYFIDKFKKIPNHMWITLNISDGNGRCCTTGHCGIKDNQVDKEKNIISNPTDEFNSLVDLLKLVYDKKDMEPYKMVYTINDGDHIRYKQDHPKQRILAALYDIKKMQEGNKPEYKDITSELAKLPIDETSDQPIKQLS